MLQGEIYALDCSYPNLSSCGDNVVARGIFMQWWFDKGSGKGRSDSGQVGIAFAILRSISVAEVFFFKDVSGDGLNEEGINTVEEGALLVWGRWVLAIASRVFRGIIIIAAEQMLGSRRA